MTFGFLLTGCQQDDSEPKIEQEQTSGQYDKRVYELSKDPQVQAELQFLKENMGVNLSHIRMPASGSNYYGVTAPGSWELELIDRDHLKTQMKSKLEIEDSNIQGRHRRHPYMATSGAKNIRYLTISGVVVPTVWKTAINSARIEWNNLGKSLTFNTPANGSEAAGQINVSYEHLNKYIAGDVSTIVGAGLTPGYGESIGFRLVVNSGYTAGGVSLAAQKKFVMAHEMGHNIGFRHTDSYDGVDVTTANYSCSSLLDPASVLRPGTSPVPSWSTFSTCDKDAFDWFY